MKAGLAREQYTNIEVKNERTFIISESLTSDGGLGYRNGKNSEIERI